MKRYPFVIVYRELAKEIRVLAVAATKRRPGYWRCRGAARPLSSEPSTTTSSPLSPNATYAGGVRRAVRVRPGDRDVRGAAQLRRGAARPRRRVPDGRDRDRSRRQHVRHGEERRHGGTGTVWEWSPGGAFRFAPLPAGETYGGVALAGGKLHGTTWSGTDTTVGGAYFTVDPATLAVTTVASFPASPRSAHGDDNTPIQEPTALRDGTVIAPREFGGAAGTGLVVQLDPRGGIRALWQPADIPLEATPRFSNATGGILDGRLAEGKDGMLYGVAQYGGAAGTGGIYRIARDGSLFALLYSFPDAAYPDGGVTVGSDGAVYGTTFDTGAGVAAATAVAQLPVKRRARGGRAGAPGVSYAAARAPSPGVGRITRY